jgi:phosphoglycolate phosphatase
VNRTLVIFDVDGTLVDSQAVLYAAHRATFAAHGLPLPPKKVLLSLVGLSLLPTFERLVGADRAPAMVQTYKGLFNRTLSDRSAEESLFDGVAELMPRLGARSDILLGIASGKSRRGIDRVTSEHGWQSLFATIQTADEHPSKPHPSMLLAAMGETGTPPSRTIFIGDTTFDIEMGLAAGVMPIGVSWGYHHVADLRAAGASVVIERIDDLETLLRPECATPEAVST